MKLHKRFEHTLPGVGYWGERQELPIRVNFCNFKQGDIFPEDPEHYHKTRKTYFCVLEGVLQVKVAGELVSVTNEAMLEISPMEVYRTLGVGERDCKFIVIGSHNEDDKIIL